MTWLFILCWVPIISFAQIYQETCHTITSFPNITNEENYRVLSYNKTIEFLFPVTLSPFARIKICGKHYQDLIIVSKPEQLNIVYEIPILNWFASVRHDMTKKILNSTSEAPFVLSLILGNKYFLPDDFQYTIRISGLSHVFALSGLHLAIFLSFFIGIARLLDMPPRYQVFFLFCPALLYVWLGGAGISLQRSFLFYLLWSISILIRIPLPLFKIWLLSFVIHLMMSPAIIASPSFILTYMAILGIIVSLRWTMFQKYFGVFVGNLISSTLFVFFMVTPFVIYYFGYLNIGSILASILILPIIPFVICLCFLSCFIIIAGFHSILIDNIINICYQFIFNISYFIAANVPTIFFTKESKIITVAILILFMVLAEIFYRVRNKRCGQNKN
ncbi:MAG: ComEC/Rec2 family competence protein [Brevinema sp.]